MQIIQNHASDGSRQKGSPYFCNVRIRASARTFDLLHEMLGSKTRLLAGSYVGKRRVLILHGLESRDSIAQLLMSGKNLLSLGFVVKSAEEVTDYNRKVQGEEV